MVYQVFETTSDVNLFLNLKYLPIISCVNRSFRQVTRRDDINFKVDEELSISSSDE